MARVLRIGETVSGLMHATQGITAGSGFATFEMRLAMVHIIDKACMRFPSVHPTLYVDDLSAEASGEAIGRVATRASRRATTAAAKASEG